MRHPWFSGVDWSTLRSIQAPYIPPGGGPQFDRVLKQLQTNNPEQGGTQYQELIRQVTSNFDEFSEPCELPTLMSYEASATGQVPSPPINGMNGSSGLAHEAGQMNGNEPLQALGPDGKPLTYNKFIGYTYKRKPPVRMALNDSIFDNGATGTSELTPVDAFILSNSHEAHAHVNLAPDFASSTTNLEGSAASQHMDENEDSDRKH
ncbi:agc ndr protein kinase [Plasmopara halstedii]|uniref:Agc ndr protein kinase n=1 Tax=Plasmopara halstedii TaxID=4781 RepID=A0A0P1B086_PLAHL|nr:agc ndr protein kinase [Plasmopara halstedii]CEG48103.1 agc ndr protein kinase [Plasmopara halstedii]|eukprot:XP_024584472.1 agc ndr protein kinase [Plasmopara halstedii]